MKGEGVVIVEEYARNPFPAAMKSHRAIKAPGPPSAIVVQDTGIAIAKEDREHIFF